MGGLKGAAIGSGEVYHRKGGGCATGEDPTVEKRGSSIVEREGDVAVATGEDPIVLWGRVVETSERDDARGSSYGRWEKRGCSALFRCSAAKMGRAFVGRGRREGRLHLLLDRSKIS